MRDPVLRDIGIRTRGRLSADELEVVIRHLVLFARGGGVVDWPLWRRLGTQTRAAFVAAFEQVRAEQAAAAGMAAQGPRQAARVMGDEDLEARMILDGFMDRVEARRRVKITRVRK